MKKLKILKLFNKNYMNSLCYIKFYRKEKIDNNIIFLEAQNSRNVKGNIYYLAKELSENSKYQNYKKYFSINNKDYRKAKKFLKQRGVENIILVKYKSKKYYKLLATAKFLFTDISFEPCFIKKEGQVIFNTWHGTPLKTLCKKVNNGYHDLGNIQKNFVIADYLLYPNEYMMNHMIEDYMINNISNAKVMLEGYPRNQVFFDDKLKKEIREEENIIDKQIIVYMPTWRGTVSKVQDDEQQELINGYLQEIDNKLTEKQILYVNLHPFVGENIDYSKFKNIKKFPAKYETYEFLSIADCLITDYSSVFFDFANTKNKIILFTYDEEEYLCDRGLYVSLDSLPFPKVSDVENLIKEINSPKGYDDKDFIETYCKYDNKNVSKKICEKVILNKNSKLEIRNITKNNKKNVLIYAGNLATNGITTSLLNLLRSIDLEKNNYFITYETSKIYRHKEVLKKLPENVSYIPIKGKMNIGFRKKVLHFMYRKKLIKDSTYIKIMEQEYRDEIKRVYSDIKFSTVIQFNGYDYRKILLYSFFECNKVIYAHNDMYKEATEKKNVKLGILKYAYAKYNKIALVTKDLIEPTNKIADIQNKYYTVNNLINYKNVINLSEEEVKFDEKTECTVEEEKLKEILNSKNKKFINIGRFSKEKGHERLIDAFEKLWKQDNSIYLIIIGGYGKEYLNTIEKANSTVCRNNIIIIKYVSNPYSILKKCDYFVLSSFYEGFGLVIVEADILNKPVISTDITGPRLFMKEHKGKLVEDSTKGIYEGMKKLLEDKIKPMNVDYEKYNLNAIKQFEKLL